MKLSKSTQSIRNAPYFITFIFLLSAIALTGCGSTDNAPAQQSESTPPINEESSSTNQPPQSSLPDDSSSSSPNDEQDNTPSDHTTPNDGTTPNDQEDETTPEDDTTPSDENPDSEPDDETTSTYPTSCDVVIDDCANPIIVPIDTQFTVSFPAAVNGFDASEFEASGQSPQIGVGAVFIGANDLEPRAKIRMQGYTLGPCTLNVTIWYGDNREEELQWALPCEVIEP